MIFFVLWALVLYVYGVVSVLVVGFSSFGRSGAAYGLRRLQVLYSVISGFGEVVFAFDVPFFRNFS